MSSPGAVAYLDHIITRNGIAMDLAKVKAVEAWPMPTAVRRALHSFLRLTCYYYCKFICDCDTITRTLTIWLPQGGVMRMVDADNASCALKRTLTTGPAMQLPDIECRFIINCVASGSGFGVVMHQGDRSLVFHVVFLKPFVRRRRRR